MLRRIVILITLLIIFKICISQEEQLVQKSFFEGQVVQGAIIEGDTVPFVRLKEIIIRPPFKFTSEKQMQRYSRLVLYVKKVYPYAQLVKVCLRDIETSLDTIQGEKAKKEYIKKREKELRAEFEDELVHLTILQGQILMKLIDRETGKTTYKVVQELKGNLTAFFWQSMARLFGSNMKDGYDRTGDDAMIEDIVIRIENGTL